MTTKVERREWVEVRNWTGPSGWIPRDVLEAMGINCSALDRTDAPTRSGDGQGTTWFTKVQSEAIRKHPEWEPTGELGTPQLLVPLRVAFVEPGGDGGHDDGNG